MDYKYIIDLDGTLYHQNVPIRHADTFINYLTAQHRSFVLFTNSPERTPAQLSVKLKNMGFRFPRRISSQPAALLLTTFPKKKSPLPSIF